MSIFKKGASWLVDKTNWDIGKTPPAPETYFGVPVSEIRPRPVCEPVANVTAKPNFASTAAAEMACWNPEKE